MAQRIKTGLLNLRIDPELKELALKAAKDDACTLTSLIEKLLRDHLKAKGYLRTSAA
jgi:predicted HicB family RNase H-like nuclease